MADMHRRSGKNYVPTLERGNDKTARYACQCGADSAHLLIFNRDPGVSWDDKIYREEHRSGGRAISVWGM